MWGWGLVARYRRARRSRRRVERRLARYCRRETALGELRRAWLAATEAERVQFLEEVEPLPY